MKLTKKEIIVLSTLVIFAFLIRFFIVKENNFAFWFDQSRDAYLSRQIIENKDFKIQGPSASGTNDSVFHGVIYYYIIAPFYSFTKGDPVFANTFLSFLASLSLIPLFILVKDISKSSKSAILACFLLAISSEHISFSLWLSNPSLGLLPFTLFYLSLWKVFYKNNKRYLFLLALSLGLLSQSALWLVYFWGAVIFSLIYFFQIKKIKINNFFTKKEIIVFFLLYLFTISSIIISQIKLSLNNIFTPKAFINSLTRSEFFNIQAIYDFFSLFLEKYLRSLTPTFPILALCLFIFIFIYLIKFSKNEKYFFFSVISSPLWLLLLHFRNSSHILMGVEVILVSLLSIVLIKYNFFSNKILNKIFIISILILYTYSNLSSTKSYINYSANIFSPQKGAFLKDELMLIDRTYDLANGQPFSISTYTNPYGYNTTWAYLYNWYGKNKYNYTPSFFGDDQSGLFGSDLISQKDHIETKHFLIIEPDTGADRKILQKLIEKQDFLSSISNNEIEKFGTIELQYRQKIL